MMSVKEKYVLRFDSRAIIAHFGGCAKVFGALAELGSDVRRRTVDQWYVRNNIPADAVATLIEYANTKKVRFDLNKFVEWRKGSDETTV